MSTQKFVITAVVAAVVSFLIGGTAYGWLLSDFFAANAGTATGAMKEAPDFVMISIGELLNGVLFTLLVGVWAKAQNAAEGFKAGAFAGFLMCAAFDFTLLGAMNISNMTSTLADIAVATVRFGVVGSVVGVMAARKG